MNARRTIIWAMVLLFFSSLLLVADDASARRRRKGKKGKINVIRLERGKRQVMPARNWISARVKNSRIVRVYLNKRRGRVTLVPRRRGRTKLEFKMKLPRMRKPVKGEMLLIVK